MWVYFTVFLSAVVVCFVVSWCVIYDYLFPLFVNESECVCELFYKCNDFFFFSSSGFSLFTRLFSC